MRSAHMGTRTEDESSFERTRRVVRHWLRSNRRFVSSTMFARLAVQHSTASSDRLTERTCAVQAKRAWSNETHRAEDAHSAGMAENGTTTYSQGVDSRQSATHQDSRETDQVWTYSELARIILHRLGPTGTVRSVAPITESLTVEMNTVNSFQNHRLPVHGRNLRATIETGIDDSPQPSTSNCVDESAKCRPSSKLQMCPMCDDPNNASTKGAVENDVAQMEGTGDDIAYSGKRHCSIRREVGSCDCDKRGCRRQQV